MIVTKVKKNILLFSLPIGLLVAAASYCGIFIEATYSLDNPFQDKWIDK
jgi:hypothetical protein